MSATKIPSERFPRDLLSAPKHVRHQYFCNWMVEHPRLVEAKETLLSAIRYANGPAGQSLIQIFGCSGVGKTTLKHWVERLLLKEAEATMQATPGYLPVVSVVTPLPDHGSFNWRDLYVQALLAMGEPMAFITRKRRCPQLAFIPNVKLLLAPRTGHAELRLALAAGLHYRDVQVCFFDEAQHFQMVTQAQRLQAQMDNLKWLAEVSQTMFVAIGTFDLLNLTDLSGQLSRRSMSIYFDRYHAERTTDYKQFASVVYAFQRHLPLTEEPDLIGLTDYLYERSLGCVGILKDWLASAYAYALEREDHTITEAPLTKAINLQKVATLAHEIASGEARLKADTVLLADIRHTLKLSASPENSVSDEHEGNKISPAKPRQARVGQRMAKRDKVGHGQPSPA